MDFSSIFLTFVRERFTHPYQKCFVLLPVDVGSQLLQIISEPDTERYTKKKAESRNGWTRGGVSVRTLGLERVNWEVPHRLEKGTSANEDAGSRREVDREILPRLWRRMKYFFIRTCFKKL